MKIRNLCQSKKNKCIKPKQVMKMLKKNTSNLTLTKASKFERSPQKDSFFSTATEELGFFIAPDGSRVDIRFPR